VAEKTNAELFTIQTSGTDVTTADRTFNKESRLYRRIWQPLKCEKNLVNQSKIEAVVARKPKSLKNRLKGKTRILLKKRTTSTHDDSTHGNLQQTQQHFSLWSAGKILVCKYLHLKMVQKLSMHTYNQYLLTVDFITMRTMFIWYVFKYNICGSFLDKSKLS